MNGRHVGVWRQGRGEADQFRYTDSWREDPRFRALSISLPLTARGTSITGASVRNYFDNLLPDAPKIRQRLKARFSARSSETFDLLEAIGRDCVGAAQLLPAGQEPADWNRIRAIRLTQRNVERLLAAVPTVAGPFSGQEQPDDEGLRISLAGAQEKTALLRMGKRWYRPEGATPTTHILKLPLGVIGGLRLDLRHLVDNEWLCSQLLKELGFEVPRTEIGRFGSQRVLVVERFDRRWQSIGEADPTSAAFSPPQHAWIARLPQEDFCQVFGIPSDSKYETHGGPGMKGILEILAKAEHPAADQRMFVLTQLVFWMLAAPDGHAKNFSIFHHRGGTYGLTPLYDVLSGWPLIGSGPNKLQFQKVKLAMGIRGTTKTHYRLNDIQPRHFHELASRLAVRQLWGSMVALAQQVPAATARVEKRLPKDFAEPVWKAITHGIKAQAKAIREYAAAI